MNGFSPEWLALREPADHRGRSEEVLAALRRRFAERDEVRVIDLGCGTGSNLRATAPYLPHRQTWILVDHDPKLLASAREQLCAWADTADVRNDALRIRKDGFELAVAFRNADLAADFENVLTEPFDLVTAAALFDLVSIAWIERFACAVARRRAAAYTALNYNGVEIWTPPHAADADVLAAFNAHQTGDKGFGPSAGPAASAALARAFRALAYEVMTGDSPTPLEEASVIREVVECVVEAARETGRVPHERLADWRAARATGAACTIGHTDLLAAPRIFKASARAANLPDRAGA